MRLNELKRLFTFTLLVFINITPNLLFSTILTVNSREIWVNIKLYYKCVTAQSLKKVYPKEWNKGVY